MRVVEFGQTAVQIVILHLHMIVVVFLEDVEVTISFRKIAVGVAFVARTIIGAGQL